MLYYVNFDSLAKTELIIFSKCWQCGYNVQQSVIYHYVAHIKPGDLYSESIKLDKISRSNKLMLDQLFNHGKSLERSLNHSRVH